MIKNIYDKRLSLAEFVAHEPLYVCVLCGVNARCCFSLNTNLQSVVDLPEVGSGARGGVKY